MTEETITTTTTTTTTTVTTPITRFHLSSSPKTVWKELLPPLTPMIMNLNPSRRGIRGCDVTVEWNREEPLDQVAQSMIEQFSVPHKSNHAAAMLDHLIKCMTAFQTFCETHLNMNKMEGFRARIVATRGSVGTKCPRFHVDHVPVRWIQSLVGPGCVYVDVNIDNDTNTGNDNTTTTLMNLDSEELERLRELLLHDNNEISSTTNALSGSSTGSTITIHQAQEQEVALLVGNRWNEFADAAHNNLPPVIHKSPKLLSWWGQQQQGRVLLTMDVMVPPLD